MTLVDSLDSIVMLYSYAGFPERSFALFERRSAPSDSPLPQTALPNEADAGAAVQELPVQTGLVMDTKAKAKDEKTVVTLEAGDNCVDDPDAPRRQTMRVKHNAMSNLSIVLTIMSILVAFR